MDNKTVHSKIIKGFAWEASTKFVIQVVSWCVTIYVARQLMPADYGILAITLIYISLLEQISEMGLASGLINKKEISEQEISGVFWFSIILGICIYIFIYNAAPYIAAFHDLPILTDILRISGVSLMLASLKIIPLVFILRNLNFRYKALAEMIAHFSNSLIVLFLVYCGMGIWSLIWSALIQDLVLLLLLYRVVPEIPKFGFYFQKTKGIIDYGIKLMTSNILSHGVLQTDVFVVGKLLGKEIVGSYSIAYQFATMPLDKIGSIFNGITFPAISRLKDDPDKARHTFLKMHRYLIIIAFPLLVGLYLLSEDLVRLLLVEEGEDKWLPVIPILEALCLINLLRVSGMIFPPTIEGLGKPKRLVMYHLQAIIFLPISFYIGCQWGIDGMLTSWFVAYPILYLSLFLSLQSYLKIKTLEFIQSIISPLICTILMAIVIKSTDHLYSDYHEFYKILITFMLGATTYVGSYVLFFRDEISDVRNGIKLLRSE